LLAHITSKLQFILKVKACAKSPHTDGLAHSFLFGWFGDISSAVAVQKLAILIWLLSLLQVKLLMLAKALAKLLKNKKN